MGKLVNCETCGKPTASTAKTCPHCGAKLYQTSDLTKIVGWILAFGLLLFIVGLIRSMM